jgi:HlyD family secretion protein
VRPWFVILLAAVAAGVIIFGVTQLGTSTASTARTSKEDVTAENGVVQSTVSGSGEVEPGVDDTLNFGTSGTLQSVSVKVGQHVKKGQLIATLSPTSAEQTLQEAEDSLAEAEDNLTEVEDGTSTGSSGSSSSGSSGTAVDTAYDTTEATASVASARTPEDDGTDTTTTSTATTPATGTTTPATGTTTTATSTTTTQTQTTAATRTTPTRTTPTKTTPTRTTTKTTTKAGVKPTTTTKSSSTKSSGEKTNSAASEKNETSNGHTTTTPSTSATTEEKSAPSASEIEQAKLQVQEQEQTVTNDEKAVSETKLYAPAGGMIASLSSDTIGQTVSSGSSSESAASDADSADTGTGATGEGSSDSSSSSSSGFAELINDNTMTMTVSLSEDDISSVKVGQVATVSITALSGVELAGRVTSISPLGSDSDGVVSYDATLTITQSNSKVLPGMSATATIVTDQAQGVTIANDAITGSGTDATVDLVKNGKVVSQPVVVGLKGTSRSQIVSGLKAGQQVQVTISLPALGTSSSNSSTTSSSTSPFGSGGFTGGAGGFAGRGAARAFFGGGAG